MRRRPPAEASCPSPKAALPSGGLRLGWSESPSLAKPLCCRHPGGLPVRLAPAGLPWDCSPCTLTPMCTHVCIDLVMNNWSSYTCMTQRESYKRCRVEASPQPPNAPRDITDPSVIHNPLEKNLRCTSKSIFILEEENTCTQIVADYTPYSTPLHSAIVLENGSRALCRRILLLGGAIISSFFLILT